MANPENQGGFLVPPPRPKGLGTGRRQTSRVEGAAVLKSRLWPVSEAEGESRAVARGCSGGGSVPPHHTPPQTQTRAVSLWGFFPSPGNALTPLPAKGVCVGCGQGEGAKKNPPVGKGGPFQSQPYAELYLKIVWRTLVVVHGTPVSVLSVCLSVFPKGGGLATRASERVWRVTRVSQAKAKAKAQR